MLEYLRRPETATKFKAGDLTIYVNRDENKPLAEVEKDRAVRKLVRTIIESQASAGVDGETTRKEIDAKYPRGTVKYKGTLIGTFKEGAMQFTEEGKTVKDRFETLMKAPKE